MTDAARMTPLEAIERSVLEQAKGILMERYDIDAIEAFDLLRRLSQEDNVKLAELADLVVRTRSEGRAD